MELRYEIVKKEESWIMKLVAWFFGVTSIMDSRKFMERYCSTFRWKIYAPGGEIEQHVLKHEKKHIWQWLDNKVLYCLRYVFSSRWRARYEVEAYLTGRPSMTLDQLVERLEPYKCKKADVAAAWARCKGGYGWVRYNGPEDW